MFERAARLEDVRQLVGSIPVGWLVWMASILEHSMHRDQPYSIERQMTFVNEFLDGEVRERVARQVSNGAAFVFEEQVLAMARIAIESGTDDERSPTPEERARFGRLLLSTADVLGSESPEGGDRRELTAFGLRSLSFQASQVFWHVIGRAYAYWFRIPPLLKGSKKYLDVGELFENAAGVSLAAYFTAALTAFLHCQQVMNLTTADRWDQWTFGPTLVKPPADVETISHAWRVLSADRDEFKDLFAARPNRPRFAGAAMVPFRQRPIFRFPSGNMVVLSSRFLLESLTSGVFWRIADHLSSDERARRRFTDFAGEIHERYVVELARSSYDMDGMPRVLTDADAKSADLRQPPSSADAVVPLADHHVFLEATISGFRYDRTILPADLDEFDRDINRFVVAKARQLETAIADYRLGRMRYGEMSQARMRERTIWPVVVLRDPFPTFFLLTDRIQQLLREGGVGNVDPPVHILSIEELELALRRHDDGRLRRLLGEWRSDAAYSRESFRNFYLERYPGQTAAAPYVHESYGMVMDLLREHLFNTSKPAAADDAEVEVESR